MVSIQTVLARRIHIIILHNIFEISNTGHKVPIKSSSNPFAKKKFRFIIFIKNLKNKNLLAATQFLSGKSEEQEIILAWPYCVLLFAIFAAAIIQ